MSTLEFLQSKYENADLQAATVGRALVARINYRNRLVADIKGAKKASKACARACLSTRAPDVMLANLRFALKETEAVLSHLRGHYRDACIEKRKMKEVVTLLETSEEV